MTAGEVRQIAGEYARGKWQYGLVTGDNRLSLADLRGLAKAYSGRYAASRDALLARLKQSPLCISEARGYHGLRYLECEEMDVTPSLVRRLADDLGIDNPRVIDLCERMGADTPFLRAAMCRRIKPTPCPPERTRSQKYVDDDEPEPESKSPHWVYRHDGSRLRFAPAAAMGAKEICREWEEEENQTQRAQIQAWADTHCQAWRENLALQQVHQDDFGTLYQRADHRKYVKVLNSTAEADGTYRDYWLAVPSNMTTARQAIAWTFGLRAEEYCPETAS